MALDDLIMASASVIILLFFVAGVVVPMLELLFSMLRVVDNVMEYGMMLANYSTVLGGDSDGNPYAEHHLNSTLREYCDFLNRTMTYAMRSAKVFGGDYSDLIESLASEARRIGCPFSRSGS